MPAASEVDILLIGKRASSLDSLKSILRGYPRLGSLQWCDQYPDGVEEINRRRPGLVLLASNLLFEEVVTCINAVQRLRPRPESLVLLEDHHDYARLLDYGVSDILMNGYSVQELFEKIDFLRVSSAFFFSFSPDHRVGKTV